MEPEPSKRTLIEQLCTLIVVSFFKLFVAAFSVTTLAFCAGLGGATAVYLVRLYTDTLVHSFDGPGIESTAVILLEFFKEVITLGAYQASNTTALPPM